MAHLLKNFKLSTDLDNIYLNSVTQDLTDGIKIATISCGTNESTAIYAPSVYVSAYENHKNPIAKISFGDDIVEISGAIDVDNEINLTSNNAITNSAVASAFTELSNQLSAYLQKKGPDQKIHSTPLDILTMVDQALPGEEGHNLLRDMCISCGEWVCIESKLPDEINGTLEIAKNAHDNKLITTTTYLKGN